MRLAKALQRRGYEVEYIIGYVPHNISVPAIQGVSVVNLNIDRTYRLTLPIVSYLRKKQPDVIFTAEDHLNVVVTFAAILSGSKAKLSASSRVTPYDTYSSKLFSKGWVLKQLSAILRKRADSLVCVSEDMVKQYNAIFGPTKYQCIYNVICDADTAKKMREPVHDPWINDNSVPMVVSAGRLAPEKGFPDLIQAMKTLSQHTPAKLVILGDGPLRPALESLIEKEGLGDSVRLLGFQDNPYKYFSRSSVFVLSSYVEGLPNVLVEAPGHGGCNTNGT
jgi:glycosyltransferase involved in cell wall biosynthesis